MISDRRIRPHGVGLLSPDPMPIRAMLDQPAPPLPPVPPEIAEGKPTPYLAPE
jgi:hypothetical protein